MAVLILRMGTVRNNLDCRIPNAHERIAHQYTSSRAKAVRAMTPEGNQSQNGQQPFQLLPSSDPQGATGASIQLQPTPDVPAPTIQGGTQPQGQLHPPQPPSNARQDGQRMQVDADRILPDGISLSEMAQGPSLSSQLHQIAQLTNLPPNSDEIHLSANQNPSPPQTLPKTGTFGFQMSCQSALPITSQRSHFLNRGPLDTSNRPPSILGRRHRNSSPGGTDPKQRACSTTTNPYHFIAYLLILS